MHFLVTCKSEDDRCKNEGARVFTRFLPLEDYGDFSRRSQGQLTPQSFVRSGRISNSSEMLCMFSLPASMKKIRTKMKALECSQHFPIITLWELSVAMDTRVPIRSGPKPNAAFPHPNDGSNIISLRLAYWLLRYSSLKMFTQTHRQTPTQTDDGSTDIL